jgi:hypothetical protein
MYRDICESRRPYPELFISTRWHPVNLGNCHMAAIQDIELDVRIERVVERVLTRKQKDAWHDAASASAHLKMSKHHFLRLAKRVPALKGEGIGRMRRWRESTLDAYQEGRAYDQKNHGPPLARRLIE